MGKMVWCLRAHRPVGECADHESGRHRDWVSDLGPDDEPQHGGALVLVWAGDYRRQEVWVASGANVGNWYCLGNEFYRPRTIPQHPTWDDVLTRGPVSLLSHDNVTAYRAGWSNGRRRLSREIESLAADDSGADEVPGQ